MDSSLNKNNASSTDLQSQRIPLFMTKRHIRKATVTQSVICVDDQFPELRFYIPKPWGLAWFNKRDLPKTPEGIEIEIGDISVYCTIVRGFDQTLVVSLDVGDVLKLRPLNNQCKKVHSDRELLHVHIDDINFAPSGRKAELIINYI